MESIKCRKVAPNEEANTGQIGLKLLEDHTGTDSNENDSGEDGEGSLQRSPKAHLKPPPARKRFSMYLISATITSTIFLLVSIALLSFLWRSSDSNTAWRVIVLANWTTRMVTLSALALRIAVSVQAGIATSMLASLIIEGTGIRIINAPEVSAIRFSNSGPHTLFWIYAKQASSCALLMLLTILTISTIATQFSSTILLSDFELISILGPPSNSWMAYGFDPTSFEGSELNLYKGIYGTDYSAHLLTEYPSFGEYSIPLERKDEIDDTGTVIRSMIPIADKDTRERLRHYRGKAFAFDARTVCIQPKIFSMQNCGFSASNDIQLPVRLCGKVAPRHTADNAVFNMNGTQFECDLPLKPSRCGVPGAADEHCTAWTLCRLRPVAAGGLISALDPTNNASVQPSWYPIDPVESEPEDPELGIWAASNGNTSWPVDLGNAFLVLNASMEQFITQNETIDSTYVGIGPWAEFKIPPDMSYLGSSFESFRVSLCYDALLSNGWSTHFQDFNVTISSGTSRKEPVTRSKAKSGGFDTTDVRRQLGVGSSYATLEERGILRLYGEDILKAMTEKQSEWFPPDFEAEVNGDTEDDDDRLGKWFYMATLSWVVRTYRRSLGPESYFCVYCSVQAHSNASIVSTTHSSIFNDALIDTGSPALALQAYLTTALRTAYYSWLPLFDAKANATTISYVDRLAPVSWRGYWIVMGMISTHITVCGITAFFFLTRTKFSLLGNIWAAFAQVTHTKQAQLVLQDATMRTDKEVAQVLMGIGGMRRRYRTISMSNGEGVRLAPTSKLDSDE